MNQELIERLRKGEIAVKNDGTLEELNKVLKEAFPEDKSTLYGNGNYYLNIFNSDTWASVQGTILHSYSVKDFLTPEFEWGEEIEVSDDGDKWYEMKFVGLNPLTDLKYKYIVINQYCDNISSWKFARKIQEEKEMNIRLTLNGKEIHPKDISEETWKKLRG